MTPASPTRVAILDHLSAGGVSRFLFALIVHMAKAHPDVTFNYFVSDSNVERDDLHSSLAPYSNVVIHEIRSPMPRVEPVVEPEPEPVQRGIAWRSSVGLLKRMPWLHTTLRSAFIRLKDGGTSPIDPNAWFRYALDVEVREAIAENDVLYIGWPYWVEPFDAGIPVVGTFHDFHFKHFPEGYDPERLEVVEEQTPRWLRQCTTAVTSTEFIRSDLLKYYADDAPPIEIVYIPPYGFSAPEPEVVLESLGRLGVNHPYVLYSGGRAAHKNLVSVISAVGLMRDAGSPVQLVITGSGTDVIGSRAEADQSDTVPILNQAIDDAGLRAGVDYLALGYVSNADVDGLTAAADAIVSASLYEAGCGPALDAWQAEVPVAFSNIPSFVEQMDRFGVEAHVFDPLDPADIAEKLTAAVFDTEQSRQMAERSRVALARYTWDDAARGYFDVLAKTVE